MTVRVVLQSRLSSARLPAKAMLTVAGMPAVVLAALRAARTGLDVVVATSDHAEDDLVAEAASRAGIASVRGSLEDPLARFAQATQDLGPSDVVVRLTADNVIPDGSFAQLLADAVSAAKPYVRAGGDLESGLPYGVAGEAFLVRDLRLADAIATAPFDREHVTPWIRANRGDTRLLIDASPPSWQGLRCTIDTFDDYVRVADLFRSVKDPVRVPWQDLANLLAAQQGHGLEPLSRVARPSGKAQSRLILGTAQLGMRYGAANGHGLPSSGAAREILVAASRAGISHVDTARAYGLSENRIGDAFQRGLSEHLSVVTKL
ncbi:MAG TPA: aldo/keto reductase, partial [Microbacterium sp.]|nr:aldo/keto reductase [Microbacterium sp.]